jgi:hypothetical protein
MKKLLLFLCATSVFALSPCLSSALPGLSVDAGPSFTMPLGNFADGADNGWGIAADAFAGIPIMPLKLGGRVAYNKFGVSNYDSDNFSVLEITPSIRYSLVPLMVMDIFLQAGMGYYRLDSSLSGFESENKYGVNAGIGIHGMALPTMSVFVMPMYNIVFTDNESTSYLSINAGLKF